MTIKEKLPKFLKEKRSASFLLILILVSLSILSFLILNPTVFATTAVNTSLSNLTIWDTTDSTNRWTYQNCYATYGGKCLPKSFNEYNVIFYANFTNMTSGLNISGPASNCSIRFDENLTGAYTAWINMTYSSSTGQYQYNRSFNFKGDVPFEINCTNSTYGDINASENMIISNTAPAFHAKDAGGNLPSQSVTEDALFFYNVSLNCSDDDLNDVPSLVFSYTASDTTLTNFTLSSSGNLTINISTNGDVGGGTKKILLTCSDSEAPADSANLSFTITAVNDAPTFINLNDTINATEREFFNFSFQATDEENNTPFKFNLTFINCSTMNWSSRNSTRCNLFNFTEYNTTAILVNFTPSNDDVGNYTIELNVTDAGSPNASRTKTIIFQVNNVNDPPNITYVCENERNATEDANFACWIVANDTDENYNLTFASNETWFTFNNSEMTLTANISSNTTAQINFTANDSSVGVWNINITITDSLGGMASEVINFNISNVNDSSALGQINDSFDSYVLAEFYLEINASDDDLRIPIQGKSCSEGCYNETLTFTANITNLSGQVDGVNTTLFVIANNITTGNTTTAYIRFTPSNDDVNNYTINLTVRDSNNYSIDSKIFNLTVFANTPPYWNLTASSFSFNEGTFTLDLNQNATDAEGDAITFTDNTDLFNINSSGYISISEATGNDTNIGAHSVTVTLTDAKGAINSSQIFIFTIKNVNETPELYTIANQAVDEDSLLLVNFSANDEDLDMNSSAADYYSENLNWSVNSTSRWINGTKLNFTQIDNRTASISFTPNKSNIGVHTVNITVNDSTGRMDSQEFTITVTGINHPPILDAIGQRNTTEGEEFYLDLNATDIEDGSDNFSAGYSLLNTNFSFASNETWFVINETMGIINFTLNSSYMGNHWINISVNDSQNVADSEVINFTVYSSNSKPEISSFTPLQLAVNTFENCSTTTCKSFIVEVRDRDATPPNNDVMTIEWKVDGIINKTETNVANNSQSNFKYYANFTDETNSTAHNISVWVSDSKGNLTMNSWNVTVNHTNAPLHFTAFSDPIRDINASSTTSVTVDCDLSTGYCTWSSGTEGSYAIGYFSDIDHDDPAYNQSLNFTKRQYDATCNTSASDLSLTLDNNSLIAEFSTTASIKRCFSIEAFDPNNFTFNATSVNFTVNLTVLPSATTPVPTPVESGGGGGSSSKKTPVALKIIVPEPVTMFTMDRIVVPIGLVNTGKIDLYDINLSGTSTLEGIEVGLTKYKFDKLLVGQEEKLEMTVITNTNQTGTYEIILSASSNKPAYTDTASFFVNLIELGWKEKIRAQEKIIFLEELLLGNPECLELQEILQQAREEFEKENYARALELAESAVQACKYAVSSKGRTIELKKRYRFQDLVLPLLEALFTFLIIYLIYYNLKRRSLKKRK